MEKTYIENFFEKLYEKHAISQVWLKVLNMLHSLKPSLSDQALALFAIYFSQLDDGNICIPLNEKLLTEKWNQKWKGLLLVENRLSQFPQDAEEFTQLIKTALPQITNENISGLPFIIDEGWLFAEKYHAAKNIIEDRIKNIFKAGAGSIDNKELQRIQDYFYTITDDKKNPPMKLKDEQALAIVRGQKENLIITGGPGTGKTTVVCYLLWELLKSGSYSDYHLYLAAPSGKAADRMKESISQTLEKIIPQERENYSDIFSKLNSTQSYTIHRLLSYNPATNDFRYNAENQFEEKSIFVIDEASMIDISLFSSLLQAIPDTARIFILGDKDQLPSVQAGAVLGELLAKKTDSIAELTQSSRFNDNSDVGRLKNAMQEEKALDRTLANFTEWDSWKTDKAFELPQKGDFPVTSFIPKAQYDERRNQVEEIIQKWSKSFYTNLIEKAGQLTADLPLEKLDILWQEAIKARILCAERKGLTGADDINSYICRQLTENKTNESFDSAFPGQLLMLTKNQNMFCLYNGDSGIVIEIKGLQYLMIKKEAKESSQENSQTEQKGIFKKGSYIFYPLYLLPKDSLETAYAITIHKSQGSGYPAILVMLPLQSGHPLLNRQIAYTAITRTEGATYIFADYETLEAARSTVIQRDTRIEL